MLGRAFWMMFGPLFLVAFGLMIVLRAGPGWMTGTDIAYLGTLVLIILGRLAEFSGGQPETATGEQATGKDLRRFTALVLMAGITFYLLANLLSNYVLN
jgi:hypothetical protein